MTIWASADGSEVLPGLEISTITNISPFVMRLAFSGSPSLTSIVKGFQLDVSGCTNPIHDGTFEIAENPDNTAKTIDIYNFLIEDASQNESGSPGTAVASQNAAVIQAPSDAAIAAGALNGQRFPAAWLNWWLNKTDAKLEFMQPRLIEGDNIAIVDNEDGTETISANITIATIDAVGNTYSQASHGFAVKDVVRHNGTDWVKAQANTIPGATDCYLVTAAPTTGTFTAIKTGRVTITGHGLTAGTLYYLSAATAGLLTTTKPVGDTTTPLGFFLPVLFVESANVVHVLGNAYPTFNPVLARYVNAGSNADTLTFSNLDLNAYGGTLDFKLVVASATNGGTGRFKARINGLTGSSYDSTAIYDTGSAAAREPVANGDYWLAGYVSAFAAFDEPMSVDGTISLSNVGGSAAYPLLTTNFNHKTGMGISRGRYTSTVANITSLTFGIEGTLTWRASASHYAELIWKGKAS